jgi:hypothetical protein
MPTEAVHATFGAASAGCLMQALRMVGRRERIIALEDDLSLGPIARTDGRTRTKWALAELGSDAFGSAASIDRFWAEALLPEDRLVVWVSRRSAREYAGFLELLRRLRGGVLRVVDITDEQFIGSDGQPDPERSLSIGRVPHEQIVDHRLIERAARVPANTAHRYRQRWARLQEANAPLRIIDKDELISAPIDYFDSLIAACTTTEWRRSQDVLLAFYRGTRAAGVEVPSDVFGWSRVVAMVKAGTLEGEGKFTNFENMRRSRVRRPK